MVAGEGHDGVGGEAALLQGRQQATDLLVHEGDLGVVELADVAQVLGRGSTLELVPLAVLDGQGQAPLVGLDPALAPALHGHEGRVGLVGVQVEEERSVRGEGVEGPPEGGLGVPGGHLEAVEALVEPELRRDEDALGHRKGLVARAAEDLRQRDQLLGHALHGLDSVLGGVQGAQERHVGGQGPGRRAHHIGVAHAARGEGVDVGGDRPLGSVAPQRVRPQGVGHHQDEVGQGALGARAVDDDLREHRQVAQVAAVRAVGPEGERARLARRPVGELDLDIVEAPRLGGGEGVGPQVVGPVDGVSEAQAEGDRVVLGPGERARRAHAHASAAVGGDLDPKRPQGMPEAEARARGRRRDPGEAGGRGSERDPAGVAGELEPRGTADGGQLGQGADLGLEQGLGPGRVADGPGLGEDPDARDLRAQEVLADHDAIQAGGRDGELRHGLLVGEVGLVPWEATGRARDRVLGADAEGEGLAVLAPTVGVHLPLVRGRDLASDPDALPAQLAVEVGGEQARPGDLDARGGRVEEVAGRGGRQVPARGLGARSEEAAGAEEASDHERHLGTPTGGRSGARCQGGGGGHGDGRRFPADRKAPQSRACACRLA